MCLEYAKVDPDTSIVWLSKVCESGPHMQGRWNTSLPVAQPQDLSVPISSPLAQRSQQWLFSAGPYSAMIAVAKWKILGWADGATQLH